MHIAAATGAALLALKGATRGCSLTDVLLLVPFFFCFVPVLSHSLGEGLYLWNRQQMRFELYDADEHPVAAKAMYVFLILATAAFVLFLFMSRTRA